MRLYEEMKSEQNVEISDSEYQYLFTLCNKLGVEVRGLHFLFGVCGIECRRERERERGETDRQRKKVREKYRVRAKYRESDSHTTRVRQIHGQSDRQKDRRAER